jgi:hypothetical protein
MALQRNGAKLKEHDPAAGTERIAHHVDAAHGRKAHRSIPLDPRERDLLHPFFASDEGRVEAHKIEAQLCEQRNHPARRGQAADTKHPAAGKD